MFARILPAAIATAALVPSLGAAAPLTLDQALELAMQRSQSARAAQAGASGAAESAASAVELPDPVLGVGIDNLPVTGPQALRTTADSMTMKRVGLSQEWVPAAKRALRRAAAQAQVGRELAAAQAALADTRVQTALAYLDAFYAAQALTLTALTERHVHEEAQAAQARLASSSGSSQEVLQIAVAQGTAREDSADVRQGQAAALVALERWVGVQPEDLQVPVMPVSPDEQTFVAAHPAVVQARQDIEAARAEAAATAANREPNWTWQASYGQRTGFPDMVSFGVSVPLPIAPRERQDRDTAAKVAMVTKAEAALEEATRAATAEYRSLSSDAQRLAQRADRYQEGVVAIAQRRVEAALAGYRSNQVSLSTLFEARHAQVDVQRKHLNLQRDLARVRAQLAFKPVAGGTP